ncbi:MAG: hypothetical protein H6977_08215 [Gammaproteobacteria bacterium]|nr:hypothetical protein [Gammaproteobacteria bacterium]MCP5199983.1 hypothetical protein [Gammaproteobacteria bacterium]
MNADPCARYARLDDGRVVFDVAVDGVEDLFNNFERGMPYGRRDLAPDVADYLAECAHETGVLPFVLRIRFARPPPPVDARRIEHAVSSFFVYLATTERTAMASMARKSLVLFLLGLTLLFAAVGLNQWLGAERSVVGDVFGEGVTVAAWVALWEALATFIVEWSPHRRALATYRRLAAAEVLLEAD